MTSPLSAARQGFVECKIRALRRHKSLLLNSTGWWQGGQLLRCSLWSVDWVDKTLGRLRRVNLYEVYFRTGNF